MLKICIVHQGTGLTKNAGHPCRRFLSCLFSRLLTLWHSLSQLSRFPSTLKLLKNCQATQATTTTAWPTKMKALGMKMLSWGTRRVTLTDVCQLACQTCGTFDSLKTYPCSARFETIRSLWCSAREKKKSVQIVVKNNRYIQQFDRIFPWSTLHFHDHIISVRRSKNFQTSSGATNRSRGCHCRVVSILWKRISLV